MAVPGVVLLIPKFLVIKQPAGEPLKRTRPSSWPARPEPVTESLMPDDPDCLMIFSGPAPWHMTRG
jgi:hypothetical protein